MADAYPDTESADLVPWRELEAFEATAQGHYFTIFPAGLQRLDALLAMISGAQRSIRAFYYMFVDDDTGRRVRDALAQAARQCPARREEASLKR